MTRILALVPHPSAGASTRYRVLQFVDGLARQGIALEPASVLDDGAFARMYTPGGVVGKALDLLRGRMRRAEQVKSARDYDAVLVHREVWPMRGLGLERALLRANPRWIFDLDDAVWLPNVSRANRGFAALKDAGKSAWIARHARSVSAGNADLARWAAGERGGEDGVFRVPTAVDPVRWASARAAGEAGGAGERRGIVLGWIGSHSTAAYLESIAPVLAALARRHPDLVVHAIGADVRLPGVPLRIVPWSYGDEVAALDAIDIGLSPMPDDPWTRGKCGLKLLQYEALQKPVVTSPVGANKDIVKDGVEGFHADGAEAWTDALERLLADAALRARMGAAGRRTVVERYSVEAVTPALVAAVRRASEAA